VLFPLARSSSRFCVFARIWRIADLCVLQRGRGAIPRASNYEIIAIIFSYSSGQECTSYLYPLRKSCPIFVNNDRCSVSGYDTATSRFDTTTFFEYRRVRYFRLLPRFLASCRRKLLSPSGIRNDVRGGTDRSSGRCKVQYKVKFSKRI
jgi:hypothetical protein